MENAAEMAKPENHARAVVALTEAMMGLTVRRGFPAGAAVEASLLTSWMLLQLADLSHAEIADRLRELIDVLEQDPPQVLGLVASKRRADA